MLNENFGLSKEMSNIIMKNRSNITTFDQILDKKYGLKGASKREEWEQQFEAFRLAENDLTSLEAFKELHYGKIGTAKRDKLEKGYEEFKSSAMIQEAKLEDN